MNALTWTVFYIGFFAGGFSIGVFMIALMWAAEIRSRRRRLVEGR